ncbi:ferredoxin [Kribbella shirazensis]|uniref:Ferredoxin n=1 Tax=Kribbella shirazensis TaxID=1105143 RepID=A0A7X6A4E7_9ACTN|nr:ferredoxin [Kribbella shirazensis]NIK61427.1 ferredoxin [Kribbella shirazensis]
MSDVQRSVGELTILVDRTLCVGFAQCIDESPEAFDLDDDGIVAFVAPETVSRDDLLRACAACPVEALVVTAKSGERLVP